MTQAIPEIARFDGDYYLDTRQRLVLGKQDTDGGSWAYEISAVELSSGKSVVISNVTFGGRCRPGIGIADGEGVDSIRQAEIRSLRDAVSKFPGAEGVRLLNRVGERAVFSADISPSMSGQASSLRDLISYSQLRQAKSAAEELGVDVDRESDRLFGCSLSELSRQAATKLIRSLRIQLSESPNRLRLAG